MSRSRLGVVLLVPSPLAEAVDGLRRAFGDPMLDQVAPHVTIVPPVNVRDEDLPAALTVLRDAGAAVRGPLDLALGPVRAFDGDEGVVYLAVGGDRKALDRIRKAALRPPLERVIDHEFVPHATLAQGLEADRVDAVLAGSAGWRRQPVRVARLHLLREERTDAGRRWRPIADVPLAVRRVVGRGGLEVELTPGEQLDPEAVAVTGWSADEPDDASGAWSRAMAARRPTRAVVTARVEGEVVGVVEGGVEGDERVWVRPDQLQLVRDQLLATWASVRPRAAPPSDPRGSDG
jgi:2'-5' RNA ligase